MNATNRLASLLILPVMLGGCAFSLRNPSISQLQHNPSRYYDKMVSVQGVVTTSWGVPLVPFKLYKINDGTGEVTVISQGVRTPARGARVRVRGKVDELAIVGGRSVGLHIREQSLYVKGGD